MITYAVRIVARKKGAMSLHNEVRVYRFEAETDTDAKQEAARRAYDEGLENVRIDLFKARVATLDVEAGTFDLWCNARGLYGVTRASERTIPVCSFVSPLDIPELRGW